MWEPFWGISHWRDFIITNPPYLASPEEVDPDVLAFEPAVALFASLGDPLFFYRKVAESLRGFPPGRIRFAEIPHERADQIIDIFRQAEMHTRVFLDLNDRKRIMIAEIG